MPAETIVILGTARAEPTLAVCHYLLERFPGCQIIIEQRESRKEFLQRRVKKLGLLTVTGQIAFQAAAVPLLTKLSAARIVQIKAEFGMRTTPISGQVCSSLNSQEAIDLIKTLNPACLVVAGTRILSREFLQGFRCPIINIHAGITPLYRGVHGAYWALAEKQPELCGVTVHRVDAGIDTGQVLAQEIFKPGPEDNFATYPWIQLGLGLQLLVKLIPQVIAGRAPANQPLTSESRLRTHPTIWEYCWRRIVHGVK
jgi:folate-dependent phosphoribosylglycinamide formyltransferase PurN